MQIIKIIEVRPVECDIPLRSCPRDACEHLKEGEHYHANSVVNTTCFLNVKVGERMAYC